ncbi:GNAT family N-acetyltransferase [Streptomyces boluensis]|uniref:GNAT family N-acetyltransferase n=1 Tax=Streptomyces boluensis TaxID=1775135 RepID=A0A964UXC4_9ACTN|nr:GNAT family N-acetyltransferase [Streptomyces boluensis]NBE53310.1 GNAT family N-acetyltransferase [Streptomyces boluensis]
MILRPLRDTAEDAEIVRLVAAASFHDSHSEGDPADEPTWPERPEREDELNRWFARTDPDGCSVAVDDRDPDGKALGVALSSRREGTWGLSLLVVVPEAQGKGVGRALLEHAVAYGADCPRGIICGSRDPRAARAYRAAGFTLHPTMRFGGVVDPARLPAPDGAVVEGGARHQELMDGVDRLRRGGARGPDHAELLRHCRLLVADDGAGSGYVYVDGGKVVTLSATSEQVAARLLTAALRSMEPGVRARLADVTAEQEWAVDVALAARLSPRNAGYLCLRGMRPPVPFVPSGAFL